MSRFERVRILIVSWATAQTPLSTRLERTRGTVLLEDDFVLGPALRDRGPQCVPRDQEAPLDELLVPLELPVLVLDRHHVVVSDRVKRGDEARPVDLTEAGQARDLPADP